MSIPTPGKSNKRKAARARKRALARFLHVCTTDLERSIAALMARGLQPVSIAPQVGIDAEQVNVIAIDLRARRDQRRDAIRKQEHINRTRKLKKRRRHEKVRSIPA